MRKGERKNLQKNRATRALLHCATEKLTEGGAREKGARKKNSTNGKKKKTIRKNRAPSASKLKKGEKTRKENLEGSKICAKKSPGEGELQHAQTKASGGKKCPPPDPIRGAQNACKKEALKGRDDSREGRPTLEKAGANLNRKSPSLKKKKKNTKKSNGSREEKAQPRKSSGTKRTIDCWVDLRQGKRSWERKRQNSGTNTHQKKKGSLQEIFRSKRPSPKEPSNNQNKFAKGAVPKQRSKPEALQ